MWDERYGGDAYFYGTEPNDFLKQQAARIPAHGKVLCLGEGEGRNAVFLAGEGLEVTALDQSAVGLAKAQRLAAARGLSIRTELADLASWHIQPGRWDAIVSIWCHLETGLRARVHAEVVAGLAPGGVLLLEAYTPAQLEFRTGGPKSLDLLPTLEGLRAELRGLVVELGQEIIRDVHEGKGHGGRSAVVQVRALRTCASPSR